MRLKPYTNYEIYVSTWRDEWLLISSIYNRSEDRWVRLHDSSTGTYWISIDVLY